MSAGRPARGSPGVHAGGHRADAVPAAETPSDAEDVLDLLEDQHGDHREDEQETSEHRPEAHACPTTLAPAMDAGGSAGAVVVVRLWIRARIVMWRLGE